MSEQMLPRGWWLPADEQPEDSDAPLWNPYWHDGSGNWMEAQSEGQVPVQFPSEIMWPIVQLVPSVWRQQNPVPERESAGRDDA